MLNHTIHFWSGECCQLKRRLGGFVGKPPTTRRSLGRLKTLMLSDPVIPIMGMNPKGLAQNKATDRHTRVFITALFIFA